MRPAGVCRPGATCLRGRRGVVVVVVVADDELQFTCWAVDSAVETSWSADCVMLLTASETEESFGTFLTAAVKLSHALSRSPVGAFCTA